MMKKMMMILVPTNVVASRPPERRPLVPINFQRKTQLGGSGWVSDWLAGPNGNKTCSTFNQVEVDI